MVINMKKVMPIGFEDFKEIIDKGMYYVDKTYMIKELLEQYGKVNLFTRPRRFGKTLNLSMLRRFFEMEPDGEGGWIDNRYLFDGLKISDCGEHYMAHQGQYPVIKLSLKSAKQPGYDMAYAMLKHEIADEFSRHSYLLNNIESDGGQIRYKLIMSDKGSDKDYADALRFLSSCLERYHKKKVIILIDEYDVPLENAYFQGFYDKMVAFIRSLFESALKTNDSLEFAVITGCLRISRESIFTGLNNLEVYSIMSPFYSDYFGFTQDEVSEILHYYELNGKLDEVRDWYDGYIFGENDIYNPWSIINYVKMACADYNMFPKPYWSNTSSNSIIRELIEEADLATKKEIEQLIAGEMIEKPVHEDITYEDIHESKDNLWNFLYFTGYLKKISEHLEDDTIYVKLAIPNTEIRSIYKRTILAWFDKLIQKTDLTELIKAFEDGDCDKIGDFLSEQLMETISFYDYAENYYHGFLAGILKCQQRYEILSNRESGMGRSDIIMKEMKFRGRAVILELKVSDSFGTMEHMCDLALQQIEEKQYEQKLLSEGCKSVLKYGICFYKKGCIVKK